MKLISLPPSLLAAFCMGAVAWTPLQSFAANVDVSAAEKVKPALPKIPNHAFSLADFGGVGGGKLVVPAGTYRTLPFTLCSNLDLHLDQGAVIQAPDTFEAMGLPDPSTLKSQEEVKAKVKTPPPLISGKGLHDVAITGPGTIDGSGAHWWAWSERAERAQPGRLIYQRPHLVVINGCERLHVTAITLRDVTITAENDFEIRDAENPVFERVTRNIQPGVFPVREKTIE